MSEQSPRDRELEALLDREGEISRAWRGASRDEPPSALDDAVRAAARRAVQAGPRRLPFGARWRVPLSIAAVLLLSATLTVLVADRREHVPGAGGSEPPAPTAEPAADAAARQSESKGLDRSGQAGESLTPGAAVAPTPAGARTQSRALAKTRAQEQAAASDPVAVQRTDRSAGVEAGPGPMPEPRQLAGPEAEALRDSARLEHSNNPAPQLSAAAPTAPEAAATPASPTESRAGVDPASPETSPAQGGAVAKVDSESDAVQSREREAPARAAMKAQEFAPLDASTWIERILVLRRQGKLKEAQQSFEAFRRRYPDYPLPSELVPPVVPGPR